MAWVESQLGVTGVVGAAGVVVVAIFALLYWICRELASPLPVVVSLTLTTLVALPGLSARPQLFSYLFIVVTLGAWLKTSRDARVRYWLIGVAWVWPMCHGMWPVGISISIAAVVGIALERESSLAHLLRLAIIPIASAAVSCLTPIGIDAYKALFVVGSRSAYFVEWGPPNFTSPQGATLAIMLAIVISTGLRSDPVQWLHVVLLLLALAWAVFSLRTTPVAGLIIAPLLGAAVQRCVPETGPTTARELIAVASVVLITCASMAAVLTTRVPPPTVPTWVDSELHELPDGTRVLSDQATGTYFLYRHPQLQLTTHGYGDVFTDAELERNVAITYLAPGWDDLVNELDADVALVNPTSELGYALEVHLRWTRLQGDEDFVLLAPPSLG
jgi:hypothetical protein